MDVHPAQQPRALAVIKNKYPAKPMIPNKSATFARTVRMMIAFLDLFQRYGIQTGTVSENA
jgi:hypothetical protein